MVDPGRIGSWNELLLSHPEALPFHTAEWFEVLRKTYGHRPAYCAVFEGKALAALLPVAEVESWLTGRRGVSLAFADCCPALLGRGIEYSRFLQEVLEIGRERKWKYFEARGVPAGLSVQPSLEFYRHTLDLVRGEGDLFAGFTSELRTSIRRAEKLGVKVEMCRNPESMEIYYNLHCKTRRRHGLPPQPLEFFHNLHEQMIAHNLGVVAVASHGQKPVAAAVFLHFGRNAVYKYGASDRGFQHLRANNLVMWEAIRWHAGKGFGLLDFGRSGLGDEGLCRFKRSFGAAEEKLRYVKYDFQQDQYVSDQG